MGTKKYDSFFRYRTLYTSYLFRIKKYEEGKERSTINSFHGRTKNTPCFHHLFSYLDRTFSIGAIVDAAIGIFMIGDEEEFSKNAKNNFVVVNKETLIRHIEIAKKVINFEYSVTKRKNYYVRLNIIGTPIQVKFLCAWVRYLYEFPANVLLFDAYRLIDAGKFTDESMFNLIMALNTALFWSSIRGDQCIKLYGKFQKDETLRKKLEKGSFTLAGLYPTLDDGFRFNHKINTSKNQDEEYSLNFWKDEDKLVDRFLVYEKALKSYKNACKRNQ